MIEHLNFKHEGNFEIKKIVFNDESAFTAWKQNLEKETNASFIVKYGSKLKNGRRTVFLCNRDGYYRNTSSQPRQRSMKVQASCKLNNYCVAYMIANISHESVVEVEYCSIHSHPIELAHVSLSKKDKAEFIKKIENDVPLSAIIHSNRMDPLELSRKGSLTLKSRSDMATKQDLRNLKNLYCSSEH